MLDRLLHSALWIAVMGLITATALSALALCYHGMFDLCAARFPAGSTGVGAGLLLILGCYSLARHGNDLMDR